MKKQEHQKAMNGVWGEIHFRRRSFLKPKKTLMEK